MKGLYLLAKSDYDFAKMNYATLKLTTDQLFLNKIAYFIQQSIKKLLKFELELHDITYPKTHDISRLIDLCMDQNIEIPQKVIDMDRELSSWCTATRYDCDFYVSKRHLESIMLTLDEWFKHIDFREDAQ